MSKVILIRRPREDTRSKTGLGRYADSIEDVLLSNGIEYEVIEARMDLSDGPIGALVDGFVRPFLRVLRTCRRDSVVHATDELCGVFFPFTRGRRIVTVHHVIRPGEDRGGGYYRLWNTMASLAIGHSDEIIAVSPDTGKDISEAFSPRQRIETVFNAVSGMYRRDPGIERKDVIGVVAELIPRKNVVASIEAFRELIRMDGTESYRMVICGRGMCREEIEGRLEEWSLEDRVDIVDRLTDEQMVGFYNTVKAVFNTSLHEGVGMVTIESNLCGTPTFHLSGAMIPSEVLASSIPCDGPGDMAAKANALLTDPEAYGSVSRECAEYASAFGNGFSDRMVGIYGQDACSKR